MRAEPYSEFVGISPRVTALIERHRNSAEESKDAILFRILSRLDVTTSRTNRSSGPANQQLDLGQGAKLSVGEKLYLFLTEDSKRTNKPDAIAEVTPNGISLGGRVVSRSRGSYLHPAMVQVQKEKDHRNQQGEVISLSAWRQWYVIRDNRLTRILDLKDPNLARTRGRKFGDLTLEDLGL